MEPVRCGDGNCSLPSQGSEGGVAARRLSYPRLLGSVSLFWKFGTEVPTRCSKLGLVEPENTMMGLPRSKTREVRGNEIARGFYSILELKLNWTSDIGLSNIALFQ